MIQKISVLIDESEWYPVWTVKAVPADPKLPEVEKSLLIRYQNAMREFQRAEGEIKAAVRKQSKAKIAEAMRARFHDTP